jgi:peptide-methionine (S)-S-oxide reductase
MTGRSSQPLQPKVALGEPPPEHYARATTQQYLAKNPNGYRCHAKTGIRFPETA